LVALIGAAKDIEEQIQDFMDGMRQTQLVGDRWKLLNHIAIFRGRTRTAIGDLVFEVAQSFLTVAKEDVVPYFRQDMEEAVQLRTSIQKLRVRGTIYESTLNACVSPDQVVGWSGALLEEIQRFITGNAFEIMRQVDKGQLLETVRSFKELLEHRFPDVTALRKLTHEFCLFADSLTAINKRELLILNDRESIQNADSWLGTASRAALHSQIEEARDALREAVTWMWRVYGRDRDLDRILVLVYNLDVRTLEPEELLATIETLQRVLASTQMP
jgi:hypothetical protein